VAAGIPLLKHSIDQRMDMLARKSFVGDVCSRMDPSPFPTCHEARRTTMTTDGELKRNVEAELAWDPAVASASIGVAANGGVVTLSGHLGTYAEKYAAERAARRVAGVKALAVELDVRISPEHRRSDTDIATAVEQALRWNTQVGPDKIHVMVEKGWVTLQGEVEWDFQRRSIEKAIRPLMGVVGVSDDITIRPRFTPDDLQARIGAALKRQAERETKHIAVEIDGATVTLRGQVHSWHEREAAQGVAWAAPGVRAVVNELTIG
jgi:osmotically-inducible protein OsmY